MRAAAPEGQDGVAVLAYRELGIAQERLVCLGQRSAIEAMAHFFCETLIRCARPTADYKVDRCSLHMTQELMSSVLGISAVHVNRVLQELRRLKLADVVRSELIVHDFDALARLGDFDDAYLAPLESAPRVLRLPLPCGGGKEAGGGANSVGFRHQQPLCLLPSGEKVAEGRMRGEAAPFALAVPLNPSPQPSP